MTQLTVLGYECRNALRSKWLYAYALLLTAANFGFSYLAADTKRTELALTSVLILLVPLVSMLFTTTYWYNAERFTELLLSQPVSRGSLFWSRLAGVVISLSFCLLGALALPVLYFGQTSTGFLWLFCGLAVSGAIFCGLGGLVATYVMDKMWGIGLGLALWFYFVAVHDGISLLILYWFRDYPMETTSAALCALNPLSLVRVSLLLLFDAPLLLGHAGALIRHLAESTAGLVYPAAILALWVIAPLVFGYRKFIRRDF